MSVRTLLLVLSTTTLSVLAGCATTQTAPREDARAGSPTQQAQDESKGCACALRPKAEDGSAKAEEGKGCGCPHCAQAGKPSADKGTACGCSHHDKGGQAQAQDIQ